MKSVEELTVEHARLEKDIAWCAGEREAAEKELKKLGIAPSDLNGAIKKNQQELEKAEEELQKLTLKAERILEKCKSMMGK